MVRRDRNHPSVVIWSIGNEVAEQWGSHPEAGQIGTELTAIVKALDSTRPITAASNFVDVTNTLITSGGLDLVGLNYAHEKMAEFQKMFPNRQSFSLKLPPFQTRSYDMPSDVIKRWPRKWDEPLKMAIRLFLLARQLQHAVDICETWKLVEYDCSGMFI
jgi:beta-galactosidase